MEDEIDFIITMKGGYYSLQEVKKRDLINDGNIFMENTIFKYNSNMPRFDYHSNNIDSAIKIHKTLKEKYRDIQ